MALRAITFDLFDTLVDLHMDRLPIAVVGGRRIPSTLGALHGAVRNWVGDDLEGFAGELQRSDRALYEEFYAVGRELPTLKRFQSFCEAVGISDPEAPQILTETHMGKLREQVRLLPHHRDVLARLRERAALAIVSNFSHTPLALQVLQEAGLERHLDAIVISEEVGIRKPRKEIFVAALERLNVMANEAVHVGDNLDADIRGAAALGLRTVWITRRVSDPEAVLAAHDGPPPSHTISDLAELPTLIRELD